MQLQHHSLGPLQAADLPTLKRAMWDQLRLLHDFRKSQSLARGSEISQLLEQLERRSVWVLLNCCPSHCLPSELAELQRRLVYLNQGDGRVLPHKGRQ